MTELDKTNYAKMIGYAEEHESAAQTEREAGNKRQANLQTKRAQQWRQIAADLLTSRRENR